MGVQNDTWIRDMALQHGMIEPFADEQVTSGVISYGVSSYGYDFRVSNRFKILDFHTNTLIDPKQINPALYREFEGDVCEIPPHAMVLAETVEYFRIPRDILTICFGKSTYARCGLLVNITPFEPEWEGTATIALSNTTSLPIRVYANEGIAQLIFLEAVDICARSYADKKGKYQSQKEITLSKTL